MCAQDRAPDVLELSGKDTWVTKEPFTHNGVDFPNDADLSAYTADTTVISHARDGDGIPQRQGPGSQYTAEASVQLT